MLKNLKVLPTAHAERLTDYGGKPIPEGWVNLYRIRQTGREPRCLWIASGEEQMIELIAAATTPVAGSYLMISDLAMHHFYNNDRRKQK